MTKIAAGAGDFISMCSVMEVGESRIKSTIHNYQTFLVNLVRASTTLVEGVIMHLDITGS